MLLEGIGVDKRALNALAEKHIYTVHDLAALMPNKYYDFREVKKVQEVAASGRNGCVRGKLTQVEKRRMNNDPTRKYIFLKAVQDDLTIIRVMVFGMLGMFEKYSSYKGAEVVIGGKVSHDEKYGFSVMNPEFVCLAMEYTPRIQLVYPKYKGISQEKMRTLIRSAAYADDEPLEAGVTAKYGMRGQAEALRGVHFPQNGADIIKGRERLYFNDLLYMNMVIAMNSGGSGTGVPFRKDGKMRSYISGLPYSLTGDQQRSIDAMLEKTRRGERLDVLLQGDVGCGKTIVAICLMIAAAENGCQSVLMAPRGVLAGQHFAKVRACADELGLTAVELRSGMDAKERAAALESIKSGKADFIVGTHSCLSDKVEYHSLGLVITDEEHLFGVAQKEKLKEESEKGVHMVSMSATPIPRTMAGILYGNGKEIIQIKEKPAGRQPVHTAVVSSGTAVKQAMDREIAKGNRCYVVCPAIDDNGDEDVASVEKMKERYAAVFRDARVGAVHGRMERAEIDRTTAAFAAGDLDILVSTTVIEVGVDVPTATIIVIEDADRYGLATLHQLRGRVGRSERYSECLLIPGRHDPARKDAADRLFALTRTQDGFEIAEMDLKARGAGDLMGTEQAGFNKYLRLALDEPALQEKARDAAAYCVANGLGRKLIEVYREHEEQESMR